MYRSAAYALLVLALLPVGCRRAPAPETPAATLDVPPQARAPHLRGKLPTARRSGQKVRKDATPPIRASPRAAAVQPARSRFTCKQVRDAVAKYPKFMLESLAALNGVTPAERAAGERCLR